VRNSIGAGAAADCGDVGSGFRQGIGDLLTDPGIRAGHHGYPSRQIKWIRHGELLQLTDIEDGHVRIVQVFAAHRPDKGIGPRP